MQSKKFSFIEAVASTLLGLCYAMPLNYLICSLNGIPMSIKDNAVLTAWMTVASVVRSYVVRRLFVWIAVWWKRFSCYHNYQYTTTCADGVVWKCVKCGDKVVDDELC